MSQQDNLIDLDTGNPAQYTGNSGYASGATPWGGPSGTMSGRLGGSPTFWTGMAAPSALQTQLGAASTANFGGAMNSQAQAAQSGLLSALQAQAAGQGPSLATQMINQQTGQNIRQQAAMAAVNPNNPMGAYAAMQNAGAMNQQAAGQAAMARTQEQLNAQNALAGLAGQMQGQTFQNAGLQQGYDLANQQAKNQFALQQANLNQNSNQFYNNMMAQQYGAADQNIYAQQQQQQQADNQLRNQLIGGGFAGLSQGLGGLAGMGGAAASDEREKSDVRDGSSLLHSLLDRLGVHDYRYKHPDAAGEAPGRFVSPMAQELERSELGKRLVHDAPDGTKMVDTGPHTVALMMSALADLHARTKKLEGHAHG